MNKRLIMIVLPLILVVIVGCGKNYDDFAACLNEKGAKMYGADWCAHCKEQKKMFGGSFKYVDYINCDFNTDECSEKKIEGYPTWVINDTSYRGVQSLSRLSFLTGCELPE